MQSFLFELITIILLSFCQANLIFLLQFSFKENQWLGWWLPFLAQLTLKENKEIRGYLEKCETKQEQRNILLTYANANPPFLFKVLGGCGICFNVWAGVLSWVILCFIFPLNAWYMVIFILSANGFLRLIDK